MKKLLLLSLALLMAGSLLGCGKKDEVEYYITKTLIEQKTGDITLREHTYDEKWNPLSAYLTLNGNFSSKTEYSYSEDYTVVTQNSTSAIYEPDTTTIVRTFDDKGLVITAETYDEDRHIATAVNTYDDAGHLILSEQTAPNSDMIITVERIYDKNGNLVTLRQDTGYSTSRQEYTYDRQNRQIREEYYLNEELTNYCELVWNENTAQGVNYSADGTPGSKMLLVYDDAGNLLVNEIMDVNGNLQSRTYNEYTGTDGSISSGIPE